MKNIGMYIFGGLAAISLICFAIFGQYELILGTSLTYLGIIIMFVQKSRVSNTKKQKAGLLFNCFLTGISMEASSIILFIIDIWIVDFEWLKYVVLIFGSIALILNIICFYKVYKRGMNIENILINEVCKLLNLFTRMLFELQYGNYFPFA